MKEDKEARIITLPMVSLSNEKLEEVIKESKNKQFLILVMIEDNLYLIRKGKVYRITMKEVMKNEHE